MSSSPRRPAPPPLEANDQIVAVAVSAGWAVALIILLAVGSALPASDRWWIWTCVTGLGLGLFGVVYVPYLKRARARSARRRASAGSEPGSQLPGDPAPGGSQPAGQL